MADIRPLVVISGTVKELPTADKLPVSALATGTPDGTKFVRDDGTLAVPAATVGSFVFAFAARHG